MSKKLLVPLLALGAIAFYSSSSRASADVAPATPARPKLVAVPDDEKKAAKKKPPAKKPPAKNTKDMTDAAEAAVVVHEKDPGQPAAPVVAPADKPAVPTRVVAVSELQRALNAFAPRHKMTLLKVDNAYGPRTRAAWKQAAKILATPGLIARVDGKNARVDVSTADALQRDNAGQPKPAAKPAAKAPAKPAAKPVAKPAAKPVAKPAAKPVAKPAKAPAVLTSTVLVSKLQALLNTFSTNHQLMPLLKTDGDYGPKTRERWRQAAKLLGAPGLIQRVDGKHAKVDHETGRAIEADNAKPHAPAALARFGPPPQIPAAHPAAASNATDAHHPAPSQSSPAGYDPGGARRLSKSVANNLKRSGKAGYDRRLLGSFQLKAGLTPDQKYGGRTRGALVYYGQKDAVQPFAAPLETVPYKPPFGE